MKNEETANYRKVFEQVMEVTADAYQFKFDPKTGFATTRMKGTKDVYHIVRHDDLIKDIIGLFGDDDHTHVPAELVIEETDELFKSTRYLSSFLGMLSEKQCVLATAVLSATSIAEEQSSCFWYSADSIGAGDLYTDAVKAAIKCYPKGVLLERLAELYVERGDEYLCQIRDGIFELVSLREGEFSSEDTYYVFDVDDVHWRN